MNSVVPAITDPLLKVKYIGFVTVAAVTVYELAIKDIFVEFAKKKHKVLGNFTESYFDRINGKIRTNVIQNEYLPRFGEKYANQFKKKVTAAANAHLATHRRDIRSAYTNLIIWRNDFAHEGKFNTTATYQEVVIAYEDGKKIIQCLAEAMVR